MHGAARCLLIAFILMTVLYGLTFKSFSVTFLPTFSLDSMTSDRNPNASFIRALSNEDHYGTGKWPTVITPKPSGQHNASLEKPMYVEFTFDSSRESKFLWPKDSHCSQYTVSFGVGIPGAWLLSFPRSGNTWTRYLLEAISGVFTGSVYNSGILKSIGFLGETEPTWSTTTIVTKTHSSRSLVSHPNRPVVLLIRNPARAIISFWNYWNIKDKRRRMTESIDEAFYATAGFHMFVREKLEKWWVTNAYALKNASRLHVVFYEKLRDNPLREIRSILQFLEVKPDKNRLFCLSRHLEGNAKGAQRDEDPYTKGEKSLIAKIILNINDLLRQRGFLPLPDYDRYGS